MHVPIIHIFGVTLKDCTCRSIIKDTSATFCVPGRRDSHLVSPSLLTVSQIFYLSASSLNEVIYTGSRILGLGDLGANGLPISIGKLSVLCLQSVTRPVVNHSGNTVTCILRVRASSLRLRFPSVLIWAQIPKSSSKTLSISVSARNDLLVQKYAC